MPSHPPERGLREGHEWDLQVIRWADELGMTQGFSETERIRLGPGGFLLPYHHPAELANRVAMLDHISGGRLNFGVAASGLPSDWALFNVKGDTGDAWKRAARLSSWS